MTARAIRIVPSDGRFASAFPALGECWITAYFSLEWQDLILLDDR